jgi:hypothetical protein
MKGEHVMAFRRRRKTKSKADKDEVKKMGKIKHKYTEVDGIIFHSEMESKYYEHLKELKSNGIVKSFTLQPEFLLQEKFIIVNGKVILGSDPDFEKIRRREKVHTVQAIKYISDFAVEYTDGHVEIVDPKGIETADFSLKKKMFMYKYPQLDLKVVTLDKEKGWISYDEHKKDEKLKKQSK